MKVVSAAAVAMVAEATDVALDKMGVTGDRFGLMRALLKSGVAATSAVLLGNMLNEPDEEQAAEPKPTTGPSGSLTTSGLAKG